MARLLLALLVTLGLSAPAAAQLRALDLYAPRGFGYVIGDTLSLSVEIVLDAPFQLDPASLPRPQPLDYWLDLTRVELTEGSAPEGGRRYRLDLTYQTFYAPLEPKRLALPALHLAAMDGERRVPLTVPAWSFLTSPLREIVSTGQGATLGLRPDAPPRPIPTSTARLGILATLATALLVGTGLAWHSGRGPFAARRPRPFTRAARQVARDLKGEDAPGYGEALRTLHRAFDTTAGRGVFAEDLPAFFRAHPTFAAAEAEVRTLFDASRRLFFGADESAARRVLPPAALQVLARRLGVIERGGA